MCKILTHHTLCNTTLTSPTTAGGILACRCPLITSRQTIHSSPTCSACEKAYKRSLGSHSAAEPNRQLRHEYNRQQKEEKEHWSRVKTELATLKRAEQGRELGREGVVRKKKVKEKPESGLQVKKREGTTAIAGLLEAKYDERDDMWVLEDGRRMTRAEWEMESHRKMAEWQARIEMLEREVREVESGMTTTAAGGSGRQTEGTVPDPRRRRWQEIGGTHIVEEEEEEDLIDLGNGNVRWGSGNGAFGIGG